MKKLGKELDFISWVRRDGSGTVMVGTPWDRTSGIPKVDDTKYLDDEVFKVRVISLGERTFIASGFNTWVVRLKSEVTK